MDSTSNQKLAANSNRSIASGTYGVAGYTLFQAWHRNARGWPGWGLSFRCSFVCFIKESPHYLLGIFISIGLHMILNWRMRRISLWRRMYGWSRNGLIHSWGGNRPNGEVWKHSMYPQWTSGIQTLFSITRNMLTSFNYLKNSFLFQFTWLWLTWHFQDIWLMFYIVPRLDRDSNTLFSLIP